MVSILLPVDCGLDREVKKLVQQLNSLNTYKFSSSNLTGEYSGKKCSPHSGMLVKEIGLSGPASVGFPTLTERFLLETSEPTGFDLIAAAISASLSLISSKTPAESSR